MISASDAKSGKGHTDENFPVASRLISPRHRAPILAFYRFVRAADDIADHATLSPDEKLSMIDALEAALIGTGPSDPEAEPLKRQLAETGLAPRHALDLLQAFRLDARKNRYEDWDDLISYCSLSAMPVGRFVLDVHGESSQATWPASDSICAALQVINHLQDCGKDYKGLNRVYLPAEILQEHGATVEELGGARASEPLLATIRDLAKRSIALLDDGSALPKQVNDTRLALEISAIQNLAMTISKGLLTRDPLAEKVHLGKARFAAITVGSAALLLAGRLFTRRSRARPAALRGR